MMFSSVSCVLYGRCSKSGMLVVSSLANTLEKNVFSTSALLVSQLAIDPSDRSRSLTPARVFNLDFAYFKKPFGFDFASAAIRFSKSQTALRTVDFTWFDARLYFM